MEQYLVIIEMRVREGEGERAGGRDERRK